VTSAAAEQARRIVEAVVDDPVRRLQTAASFYEDRPYRGSIRRYRRAELSFMQWQQRRGALAPVTGDRPGSPWWRAVNADLLRDTWEADRLMAGEPGPPSGAPVARWLEFLRRPTPRSWYRAHNTSISAAYLDHRELCLGELPVERFFMDVTLARVLFVHSMVTHPHLGLGPIFWPTGRLVGDPRSRSVDTYLSLRNVLPDVYPISNLTITDVLDGENFLGRLIDYGIMLPRVQRLYEFAADDLGQPHLRDFIRDGSPVYAWPYEARAAWRQRKHRNLGAFVRRIVAAPHD
jgi:hypothetical protein